MEIIKEKLLNIKNSAHSRKDKCDDSGISRDFIKYSESGNKLVNLP
jgi:hypothetical protein